MGKNLGLFGVSDAGSAKQWLQNHHDWIRAASHTAWGVFNFITFVYLLSLESFSRVPLCSPGEASFRGFFRNRPF